MGDRYTDAGYTTKLAEASISSVDKANETFGRRLPGGEISVVLFPGRNCLKPFMTVPSGCYARLCRGSAQIKTIAAELLYGHLASTGLLLVEGVAPHHKAKYCFRYTCQRMQNC